MLCLLRLVTNSYYKRKVSILDSNVQAQQILNDIFDIMQKLYNEMRSNGNGKNHHLKVFGIFAELGRTLVGADRASFWRWNKKDHKLVTTAATGTSQIVIDETAGLVGRALSENRTIISNDPYHHPDFNSEVDKKTKYVTKSVLVMPVSNCHGEAIGAFQVINKLYGDKGFDESEDVKRLSIAAFICGIVLESDIFLDESQHDKLTGLKNRCGFYSDYQTRYQKVFQDTNATLKMSIIICDIDFFKKVNDTYGHNGGDAVLAHISELLKVNMRNCDNVYRWGGEEFLIVLEETIIADAASIAEHIRMEVENSICPFEDKNIKVTMSFGCAEIDPKLSIEENIKIADEQLYQSKENGRNRVTVATK